MAVVGQNMRKRRLRFSVRVPGRSGPNDFIQRHYGLHCGMRWKSEINAQTFAAGELLVVEKGFQTRLRATHATAGTH